MVALEISKERRPSNHPPGNASVDPEVESRECPVECRDHPWTFGATRFRSTLSRHHQEVHGQAQGRKGQVPNVVDLPGNHLEVSWAMDFFTVPTLRFQILYIFVILNHSRRQVVHFAVTAHPTMAWVIQQLREAMPFGQQPSYLFRDNDGIYGDEVGRFLVGTGIAEVKTAHRCPWQNPFVERYGGTLRRELLDHVVVLNEEHLKRLLKEFIEGYYHRARPHQGLHGDTPVPSAKPEPVADASRLVSIPVVGGLHHRYIRVAA